MQLKENEFVCQVWGEKIKTLRLLENKGEIIHHLGVERPC